MFMIISGEFIDLQFFFSEVGDKILVAKNS
jgi:hypothetical protein